MPERQTRIADKALRYFDATSLCAHAEETIASAARCKCCSHVLALRFDRLGSTLFYDDDPRSLIQAFSACDRDACTLRLLAACIILHGRERTTVH